MNKTTLMLIEKVQGNAQAAKYLAQSRAHQRAHEESSNFHALFKGEDGDIEKGMSRKYSQLKSLHKQVADLCLQIHTIHKGGSNA